MIKVYFDNALISDDSYAALSNDYKLFTDNFYLGSTASNTFKLSVAKSAVSSHPTEVKITDDTNTYYLIVDKIYEEKNFYVYDLVDKLVLFNFNYNAKPLIDLGTTTLSDILSDMCTQAGIVLDSTLTLINDIEVTWYDNTLLARDYLSYIAELQGGFARILDDGKLTIVGQKMTSQATLQIDNCEDFLLGEKKTISRVVYDNGIVKYEYGDETANTLYINPNNVYITDTTVVSNIYDAVVGLEFYLVETGRCQLDPSVRAGDVITFTDGTNSYLTIAGYSASYGGGNWLGNYSLNVASKQQEETQVIGLNTELKSIKTIIDRTNASLSIVSSSVETLESEVENIELQRPFYRYSANADGSSMTESPQVSTRYLGTYVGTTASANYTDYTWTLIKGADGQDGADGTDGVGITSATVTYQLHTNGTTAPTGSWLSSPPTPVQGKYLWVRTVTTYSDSSSSTTYAVSYYATDGQTGEAGTDGTGIASTEVKYQIGASGTVAPTGSWLSSPPTPVQGKYLWTRTIITYTDTTTSTAYSTSYYATDGQNGTDGVDGDDGKSLWLAYCDEIDTYTGFSIDPEDSNKDYYGMYVGLTQSNTATDYEWYPSNYKIESEIVSLTTTLTQTAQGLQITTEQVTENTNIISSTQTELLNINEDLSVASDNATLALEGVGTLEDTTSGLLSTTNDLTTRLEYQETTVSDLVLDIDGVKQSMTYSGGYNLIENCVKQFGEAGWTGTFVNYSNTEIQQNSLTKSALVFMEDTETREIQTENRVHNFSFKYKKLVPLATASITINGVEIELTEEDWTEVEQNILVESNLVTIEYSSDADNSVWLVDPLLIPGNIKQIWTPNPNEINTGIIKLGGDTLSIESTSSSTVFKASTDGTRVYNVNDLDNPIAEFTSEGVETNKITGKKGEIGKVLILDLGTQTWFTRT